MKIFSGSNSVFNQQTDPKYWAKHLPGMVDELNAVKDLKQYYEDNAKITNHGRIMGGSGDFKHVASIRGSILNIAEVLDEEFLQNDKKFYGWLDEHPEYCAYNRKKKWRG